MSFECSAGLCEVGVRALTPTLRHQDVWTPSDLASFAGIDIKTALKLVRSLPHLRAGRRYFVARAVVLAEFGLDPEGRPTDPPALLPHDPQWRAASVKSTEASEP